MSSLKRCVLLGVTATAVTVGVAFPASGKKPSGDPKRGEKVWQKLSVSCLNCHKFRGKGSTTGPDLTNIGAEHDEQWLFEKIKNPKSKNPKTIMPPTPGPDKDLRDLAAFLAQQGKKANPKDKKANSKKK